MPSPTATHRWRYCVIILSLAATVATGCSRTRYRLQADQEVAELVTQKSFDQRWAIPGFTLATDPRSRYHDPSDPDRQPLPPDDPASHLFMHCIDGKRGWKHWHRNGDLRDVHNPFWRDALGEYAQITETGALLLDLPQSVNLAYMHSSTWRTQLETLYLSALDVSAERFRFDVQFFGGTGTNYAALGDLRFPPNGRTTLSQDTDFAIRRRFATAGELLVGFANSFVWEFTGTDTNSTFSLLNFSLVQPLLRFGGRVIALEQLTITERALLANLRAINQYRQGYFTNISVGDQGQVQGPQRRGGFFGGTGLTGFTGQGTGGFGGVGAAGNFGFFGFGAGGAGGGAGGAGVAGGGAGNVGGFIGLLQAQQQVRNQEDTLALSVRTLRLLEANLDAGLIDITQVDIFRQSVETDRANLLQSQNALRNQIETFVRTTIGFPPDLPVELDDSLTKQFQFIDRQMTGAQNHFLDFVDRIGASPGDPSLQQLQDEINRLMEIREGAIPQFASVESDLAQLETQAAARERLMEPEERSQFAADKQRLYASLADIQARFENTARQAEELRGAINAENVARGTDTLVALANLLADLVQELALVQARARLESVVLEPIQLDSVTALEIARANRLDWMNNRANLVDTWRLIEFNANALMSDLDVTFSGDMGTVGKNPLDFRSGTGTLRAGLRFDAPFTRLLERNNYRSALISYQQDRRQLIQFEDQVNQSLRQTLRQLELLRLNLAIQRRAVAIAVRRVDQTREDLAEPPTPTEPGQLPAGLGPTAAQNLVSALNALRDAQNNFMSVWLNYYATRMGLYRDLGIMEIDARGMWVDRPLNEVLGEVPMLPGAEEIPPPVTPEMLRDAGIDPDAMPEEAGEGLPVPQDAQPPALPPGDAKPMSTGKAHANPAPMAGEKAAPRRKVKSAGRGESSEEQGPALKVVLK